MSDEKSKLNGWDKVVSFFSAKEEFKRQRFRTASNLIRKYEGASKGRRTSGWTAGSTSANSEISASLVTLRNRARQLIRDNPYAARGVQVIESNVVGKGIFTQIKVDTAQKNKVQTESSKKREKKISATWNAWANTYAIDYDGRNDITGLQRLVMRSVVESGEVLVRRRRTRRRIVQARDGSFIELPSIQLQILESDFLDSNGIGASPLNGNTVIQGIEFDKQGNRVAYHLFEEHPGDTNNGIGISFTNKFKTVRVPAEEILHVFKMERPGQIRGVPWLSNVLLKLRDFDEYEDAQLVRQKIAAMFAVFVRDIDGIDATMQPEEGELGEKVEPGIIEILPPGKDISFAKPPEVQNYKEYINTVLRSIAAGLGITFESLTGDLSEVNFSSARMGFLEMNRNIEMWRSNIIIPQFLSPVFQWFLESIEITGEDVSRVRSVWTPPKREMIDPSKEIKAQKEAVRSGFMSLSEVLKTSGFDPEQHYEELKRDQEKLDELGLVLDSDPRQDSNRQSEQDFPESDSE